MYFRRKTSSGRVYLQIVESRREGDQVRQQVIATLGRVDELRASGQLERLLRSGARFAAKALMVSAAADDTAIKVAVRRIGPALVFERLWEETGCRAVIAELAGDRLRRRFDIARVCVVADRGMISAETMAELEARRLLYILGVRERSDKLVRELVLDDPAPFVPLAMKKRGKEIDYEAKAVKLAGRRYIVCRNRQEAEKDAADRASIVTALERQLARGDKALVSNTGFRRYLKTIGEQHFAIDPDKIEQEKKFDGI